MKRIFPSLLIASLLVYLASCEKDDICVDGDTPLLVVRFYNIDDTTASKDVPSLRIKEVILDTIINTIADRSSSLDSIGVPLRIAAVSTQFAFIMDSADDADTGVETGNIDTLTISYQIRETYISKACGFVANYDNLTVTLPESASNWIQDISIAQETVENSNNVHVKIFH